MKMYEVKPEYWDLWATDGDASEAITIGEIERLALEWDKPMAELMEQVEEIEIDSTEMLREAQRTLELTQKELGVYIGVPTRTINAWMTEYRVCPDHTAELVYRLAQVDRERLDDGIPTTSMYRWALMRSYRTDEFLDVYGSKADAMRDAEYEWQHMTEAERESSRRFEVGLVHVQICEKDWEGKRFQYAEIDDRGRVDGDVYEFGKDWKE